MLIIINQALQAVMNILLFAIIPLLWYLISKKTFDGSLKYIGFYFLKKFDYKRSIGLILTVYSITAILNIIVIITGNSGRSIDAMEGLTGIQLVSGLVLYGIQTGVAEEILFRGFIAKRLIKKIGFVFGNFFQALIFAIPHLLINGSASTMDIVVRIINAFIIGYAFGYLMKKKSNGSIIPVMIAHILMNIISSAIMYFVL